MSKKRSRSPDKRLKKILEESITTRDYDAEERIGGEEDVSTATTATAHVAAKNSPPPAAPPPREKTASPTTEKSDNMDISNSP